MAQRSQFSTSITDGLCKRDLDICILVQDFLLAQAMVYKLNQYEIEALAYERLNTENDRLHSILLASLI